MELSKGWKYVIGIPTFIVALLPIFIFGIALLFLSLPFIENVNGEAAYEGVVYFLLLTLLMVVIGFVQLGLMIFYFVHIIKNRGGSELLRILLGLGVYFLPYVAMPIYFLIYILPTTPSTWAMEATSSD